MEKNLIFFTENTSRVPRTVAWTSSQRTSVPMWFLLVWFQKVLYSDIIRMLWLQCGPISVFPLHLADANTENIFYWDPAIGSGKPRPRRIVKTDTQGWRLDSLWGFEALLLAMFGFVRHFIKHIIKTGIHSSKQWMAVLSKYFPLTEINGIPKRFSVFRKTFSSKRNSPGQWINLC